ncbi:MAG: ECF transporter S component [Oscillospiraceae bacterium]|nr:ECF transporter S component [Oscillospiraceae bacterium]
MSAVKKICVTALCIAFCYVLPIVFHAVGLGSTFLPIHIPVMVCGIICGPLFGAVCGIAGPVLSSVLTGMPPMAKMVYMLPEIVVYGLLCGLLIKVIRTKNLYGAVYFALVPAMIAGKIIAGVARALLYAPEAGQFTIAAWAVSYFAESLPGIILHLIVVPAIVFALVKARVVASPLRADPSKAFCKSAG